MERSEITGNWQELIESILWAHEHTRIANLVSCALQHRICSNVRAIRYRDWIMKTESWMPTRRTNAQVAASGAIGPMKDRGFLPCSRLSLLQRLSIPCGITLEDLKPVHTYHGLMDLISSGSRVGNTLEVTTLHHS